MGEFAGQVAVVTGGARGIGAEIGRRLARGGASVICADVLDTAEIVAEIKEAGGIAEGRALDVTDAEAASASIAKINEDHGRIDILINNAGITRDQLLVRMKPDDWDLVLGINLDGVFRVTQPNGQADDASETRTDRQCGIGGGFDGKRWTDQLLGIEGWSDRFHQEPGARTRSAQHHRQRGGARLHSDTDDRQTHR